MSRNPMLSSGRDAQNIGINTPDKSSQPMKSFIQGMNDFNLSYTQLATLRYADIHPFFCMDDLPADIQPYRSKHDLRSYTLQSPMLSEVKMHKSFTMVPMQAILPNTWERFIVKPTKGDDVPDDAYCYLNNFISIPLDFLQPYSDISEIQDNGATEIFGMIISEAFCSRGSLLSALGIDFSSLYPGFDEFFDNYFVPYLKVAPYIFHVNVGASQYPVTLVPQIADSGGAILVSVRDLLDFMRDGSIEVSVFVPGTDYDTLHYEEQYRIFNTQLNTYRSSLNINRIRNVSEVPIDLSRLYAYQLSCVSIQTDDSIDDIYTPALFRDLIYEYATPEFFYYNGSPVQYDAFSQRIIQQAIDNSIYSVLDLYKFVTLLFSFRKSLKFGDYFIDARPRPFSVGDMSAEVRDGEVSAIDTTRSILAQRFLNWSNRIGNKFHDYILSLTGVVPTAITTDPKYIIHEVFPVTGFEVENTGSEQRDNVAITTQLKAGDSRFLFDITINEYCIILGLAHFDVKRNYVGSVDRNALKTNRYDYFNKFFQYAGDQDIKRIELNAALNDPLEPMAYTTRHMQYKTAISRATGGFATSALKSWAFTNEESTENIHGISSYGINSDFIRNWNSEFDRFYGSLTGYSLGNYFHFICKFENIVPMSRKMAVAPDIL